MPRVYAQERGTDDENGPEYDYPNGDGDHKQEEQEEVNYAELFGAPDFSKWIRRPNTTRAKQYEQKVGSIMKAGLVGSMNNQQFADAATFLKYGPGFSRAAGELADNEEKVRNWIDMIATPSNPWAMAIMAGAPMVMQFFRNHQKETAEAKMSFRQKRAEKKARKEAGLPPSEPKPGTRYFEIGKGKFKVKIPFRVPKLRFNVLASTQRPEQISMEVFSDKRVIDALRQMGITLRVPEQDADQQTQE